MVVQISAATAAACGAAIEVPLKWTYPAPPFTSRVGRRDDRHAGAARSTSAPVLEKLAWASSASVAATPITFWQLAGAVAPVLSGSRGGEVPLEDHPVDQVGVGGTDAAVEHGDRGQRPS